MTIRFLVALACCALAAAAPAQAAITTSISTNTGTPFNVGSIATFEPTGENMAGMQVTVTFADGFTESQTWVAGAVGSKSGSAGGTSAAHGWSLTEQPGIGFAGDTFGGKWSLTVGRFNTSASPVKEVLLYGPSGNTLFDLKDPTEPLLTPGIGVKEFTPGSERGWSFETFNTTGFPASYNLHIGASYENAVQVAGQPAQDDLYTTLRLSFSGDQPAAGLNRGYTLVFFQDTDLAGGTPTQLSVVPEPSSLIMFAGLAVIGGWQLRRRQKLR